MVVHVSIDICALIKYASLVEIGSSQLYLLIGNRAGRSSVFGPRAQGVAALGDKGYGKLVLLRICRCSVWEC